MNKKELLKAIRNLKKLSNTRENTIDVIKDGKELHLRKIYGSRWLSYDFHLEDADDSKWEFSINVKKLEKILRYNKDSDFNFYKEGNTYLLNNIALETDYPETSNSKFPEKNYDIEFSFDIDGDYFKKELKNSIKITNKESKMSTWDRKAFFSVLLKEKDNKFEFVSTTQTLFYNSGHLEDPCNKILIPEKSAEILISLIDSGPVSVMKFNKYFVRFFQNNWFFTTETFGKDYPDYHLVKILEPDLSFRLPKNLINEVSKVKRKDMEKKIKVIVNNNGRIVFKTKFFQMEDYADILRGDVEFPHSFYLFGDDTVNMFKVLSNVKSEITFNKTPNLFEARWDNSRIDTVVLKEGENENS